MGRYIKIKKYMVKDSNYYYEVSSIDYPEVKPFFIGINSDKKTISFFKTTNFSYTNHVFDLTNNEHVFIDWLPDFFIYATIYKAKQAVQDKHFSEYISFQS